MVDEHLRRQRRMPSMIARTSAALGKQVAVHVEAEWL